MNLNFFSNIVMKPWICEDSELGGNTVSKTVQKCLQYKGEKSLCVYLIQKQSYYFFKMNYHKKCVEYGNFDHNCNQRPYYWLVIYKLLFVYKKTVCGCFGDYTPYNTSRHQKYMCVWDDYQLVKTFMINFKYISNKL